MTAPLLINQFSATKMRPGMCTSVFSWHVHKRFQLAFATKAYEKLPSPEVVAKKHMQLNTIKRWYFPCHFWCACLFESNGAFKHKCSLLHIIDERFLEG